MAKTYKITEKDWGVIQNLVDLGIASVNNGISEYKYVREDGTTARIKNAWYSDCKWFEKTTKRIWEQQKLSSKKRNK